MEREDRRRGPDVWVRLLRYMAVVGWTVLIASFFVFGRAKPQVETFIDRYYHVRVREYWDMAWLRPLLWLLVAGLVLGIVGLAINRFRHRRRSDQWRFSWYCCPVLAWSVFCCFFMRFEFS